jgi:putative copper resistance protein D
MAGIAAILVAIESGLASYDDINFTAHVVQHLLLMNLAPPLLAMSAPITLALQSSRRETTSAILKVLHSPPARLLIHPLVAGGLMVATMYAYFLTPIYRISIEHVWFHYSTHVAFLTVGCLYWWPIVGSDVLPRRWGYGTKLLLLGAAIPWMSFLGVAITEMAKPIAPEHSLTDTHNGGALLWIASELFTLGFVLKVFFDWAAADTRDAARADRRAKTPTLPARWLPPPAKTPNTADSDTQS